MISLVVKNDNTTEEFDLDKLSNSIKIVFDKCGTCGTSCLATILALSATNTYQEHNKNDQSITTKDIRYYTADILRSCGFDDEAEYYNKHKSFKKITAK